MLRGAIEQRAQGIAVDLRDVRLLAGDELRICDSADAALLALGEPRMPAPFVVRLEEEGDIAIIAVEGEFDLAGKNDFQARREDALALNPRSLIVDLESCQFIDSTGIALLLRSRELAAEQAIGFALAASVPQVHRTLELVGLPQRLATFDTREDAIKAFAT